MEYRQNRGVEPGSDAAGEDGQTPRRGRLARMRQLMTFPTRRITDTLQNVTRRITGTLQRSPALEGTSQNQEGSTADADGMGPDAAREGDSTALARMRQRMTRFFRRTANPPPYSDSVVNSPLSSDPGESSRLNAALRGAADGQRLAIDNIYGDWYCCWMAK